MTASPFPIACLSHSLTHQLPPSFLPSLLWQAAAKRGKVKSIMARENWQTNIPSTADVMQAWVAPLKAAIQDDPDIIKSMVDSWI